jgi:ferrous-iron efflux pump FieF
MDGGDGTGEATGGMLEAAAARPAAPVSAELARVRWVAARTALLGAALLAVVKLATAVATGSLAVLATFVDSLADVFTSGLNAVALRIAERPADADHTYGHGKAESLAGLLQGAVIAGSGVALLVEAVRRLAVGATVTHSEWGVAVLAFAIVVTGAIVWRLRQALRQVDSLALRAEWAHYATDFAVNGAALAALAVQWLVPAVHWADPAASVAIALYIIRAGAGIFRESVDVLMDKELPEADVIARIRTALQGFPEVVGFHSLRTRRSGPVKFVDLHLDIDRDLSFARAHAVAERAIVAIETAIPGATVWVHADPWPPDADEQDPASASGRHFVRPVGGEAARA